MKDWVTIYTILVRCAIKKNGCRPFSVDTHVGEDRRVACPGYHHGTRYQQ